MFGMKIEKLTSTSWLELVMEEDRALITQIFEERTSKPLDVIFRIMPGPEAVVKTRKWIRLRSEVVRDTMGCRVLGIMKDVTQEKIAELDSAQKVHPDIVPSPICFLIFNGNQTAWVRTINHEIRNPLSASKPCLVTFVQALIGCIVWTMVNILLEGSLGSEQRDLLETIKSTADSLLALINSILGKVMRIAWYTVLIHEARFI